MTWDMEVKLATGWRKQMIELDSAAKKEKQEEAKAKWPKS